MVHFKKHVADAYVPFGALVDEALAWGWVDSAVRGVDEERVRHLFSPRNPKSAWSAVNKEKVERLIAAGRMQPSGLAMVETARRNGMWDFLNDVDALIEPDDLKTALDEKPASRRHWDGFAPSSRRGILEWIKTAKTPQTRQKRIGETVRLAALAIRANHPR